jgi:hypothetical protein
LGKFATAIGSTRSRSRRVLTRRRPIQILLGGNEAEDVSVRRVCPPKRFEMEMHMYELDRATEVYFEYDGDKKEFSSAIRWFPEMRRWSNFGKPDSG